MVSPNGRAEIAVEGETLSYEENQGEKATQPQTCTCSLYQKSSMSFSCKNAVVFGPGQS